ncbi:hypothetical protein CHUV0807_1656 [Cardiobacterium hominis]|uniref:Uncharacterized protein n=1 Tax=Cardiobacterium hominis TaxID=2718 RepID=A0A1C3H571_9GAMM|nr:hypothetical protein CHUV0807_1656 [Cardiobacterium hominis]
MQQVALYIFDAFLRRHCFIQTVFDNQTSLKNNRTFLRRHFFQTD